MPKDIAKYAKERAEARASGSWYKLKADYDNCFRILPTPPSGDNETPFIEYNMHRDVGPRKLGVRCGVDPVSREGKCWLCDVKIPALRKKGHESRAAALQAKPVFLIQVAKVEKTNDEEDRVVSMKGPFLFTPAKTLADQLLTACFANKRRSYVDPKKGYNINVQRTGSGKNDTRYGSPEPDARPSPVPPSIIEKLLSFDELKELPKYSAAKQQAVYAGRDVIDEDEEEEDDMPTTKARKGKTKPVVEPEEDEEEDEEEETDDEADSEDEDAEESDDEEEADEDEEEDAPPPKKKAKKSAPVVKKKKKPAPEPEEDEDEEEEDEDEDSEDEDAEESDDDEEVAEEDEEEDAPPPKKKKLVKKTVEKVQVAVKKKKKPEPEPEEEEDEEEDEDEDLDTEDIPDEEEDEDEEEDAPPPKKKKVVAKPVVVKKKKR
jgi:hypothetical protein